MRHKQKHVIIGFMSERIVMSEAEIRAVYAQGEEAVVALVKSVLAQINVLAERVQKREDQVSKDSRNDACNNIANSLLDYSIRVPRDRLRGKKRTVP